ncbi:MAG: MFS transporter [Beijerinckiaceae bacterium]
MTVSSSTRAKLTYAIALIAVVGFSLSLYIPLLAISMERMQVSATLSGLNTAIAGVGTLCALPFVPRLAARLGIRAMILGSVLLSSATAIGFYLLPFVWWFPLRFTFGVTIGTLFVLSEYWITSAAPPDKRGVVMGVYATVLSLGFASGPLLLTLTGTTGAMPYVAGAALFLVALIPLALSGPDMPSIESHGKSRVIPIMLAVPVATLAALVFGSIETGGFALFPAYGIRNGMSEVSAATLISIVAAGNVISQIPIGWLSDHFDRRKVLLMCALAGVVGCMAMPFALYDFRIFATVLFIWGGFTGGLYTVGLAHLSARFSGMELANANAAFVMLYSVGLVAGPPLVGLSMDQFGKHGFALALGLMLAAYATLVAHRIMTVRG